MHGGGTGIETYVYNEILKNGETGRIATLINDKAVEATGMKNRGVKTKDLAIIRDTRMKACLIECGFMDNANDTPRILTEEYANKVSEGIVEGILIYYNIENKEDTTDQNNSKKIDVKYQVYTNKWLPDVMNTNDYAGIKGEAISGFRGNTIRK